MWYLITDSEGNATAKLYAASPEDVALNTPEGCTATECDPEVADSMLPVAPPPPPPPVRYTFNQWVDRFPFEAQVAIVTATTADPVAKLIYDRAMSAGASGEIDPTDPRTVQGVEYLVVQGYITREAADAALAS